jgi:hypothetical protein
LVVVVVVVCQVAYIGNSEKIFKELCSIQLVGQFIISIGNTVKGLWAIFHDTFLKVPFHIHDVQNSTQKFSKPLSPSQLNVQLVIILLH